MIESGFSTPTRSQTGPEGLGPIGTVVAVRAAGLGRGEGVAVGIVALPVSAIAWFMYVATLGGALGMNRRLVVRACGAAGCDLLGHPSFPHRVEKLRGPPREQVAALDEPEAREPHLPQRKDPEPDFDAVQRDGNRPEGDVLRLVEGEHRAVAQPEPPDVVRQGPPARSDPGDSTWSSLRRTLDFSR